MDITLSPEQLRKVVVGMPHVLGYSVDANLEPTLAFYGEALGVDREGLAAFISGMPSALIRSLTMRLRPRHDRCVQTGMKINIPVMNAITKKDRGTARPIFYTEEPI